MSSPLPVLGFQKDKQQLYAWQVPVMGWSSALGAWAPLAVDGNGAIGIKGSTGEYETVIAGQTAVPLGASGATGDYLDCLLVTPANTSPGSIILLDGATSYTVFAGGANSVSNLIPFVIPIGAYSVNGPWKVTTGADLTVFATGDFV